MIYDQANTPSLSQWLGASLYLLAHLPHWVALFHASGGSNLRSVNAKLESTVIA